MSGPAVSAIDVALASRTWAALGFVVASGVCHVGATSLLLDADGPAGTLPGWELRGPPGPAEIDGIPTRWSEVAPQAAPEHPVGATQIDHVVVATPDVDRTFAALASAGMTLRRERTGGSSRRPLRQGFFRHGEAIVEVVGPVEADGDGPASLWGLVVVVVDMAAAATVIGAQLGRPRDAVQPGRRIATVQAEAIGGLPLALMSEQEAVAG